MRPELVLDARATLGESPRWHDEERRLYWVDIGERELHRFDPETGVDEHRRFAAPVACFGFRAKGGFVLGMKDGFALLDGWDDEPRPFGEQLLADMPDHRMNDGRVDPWGRFWAGSLNGAKTRADAGLYRIDPDGRIAFVEGGMMTANGAAFDAEGRRFHHADTPSHMLRCYDVDDGDLTGRHILHRFPHGQGRPDGGSFDEAGCYWTALFDGGRVVRLSPDGAIVAEVLLPVSRPTMIVFGGKDRRTAYVTSARTGLAPDVLAAEPMAGGIFAFRVDVPGVPEWRFAG